MKSDRDLTGRMRLILAAEKLVADEGVDAVSLRAIARHADHQNPCAVQYHFGDREGLLAAVMALRRPVLDIERAALARQRNLEMENAPLQALVSLINEALFHQESENGKRSFARFLRAIEHHDMFTSLWNASERTAPYTHRIYAAIRRHAAHLDDAHWELRRRQIGMLSTTAIADYDRYYPHIRINAGDFLDDLARTASAAFLA